MGDNVCSLTRQSGAYVLQFLGLTNGLSARLLFVNGPEEVGRKSVRLGEGGQSQKRRSSMWITTPLPTLFFAWLPRLAETAVLPRLSRRDSYNDSYAPFLTPNSTNLWLCLRSDAFIKLKLHIRNKIQY
jgi:hypothetical protein